MSNKLMEILLAENGDAPTKVQLLRAGTYDYWGETLDITADSLRNMKKNFDDNVLKTDIMIDYYHASYADAAAWIKEVILENNDTELWIIVEWTARGKEKIMSKELRYLSVDFEHDYKDNETGQRFGITLKGGGLTNRPFVKGMNPILSDEIQQAIDKSPEKLEHIRRIILNDPEKEKKTMDFNELVKEMAGLTLSDEQKAKVQKIAGIETNNVKLANELASLKSSIESKDAEIKTLSEKITMQEKEASFSVMLSEGKAVPAQKDAFMKGDVAEFARNAVAVNLSAAGKGDGSGVKDAEAEPKTAEEAEAKVIALSEKLMRDNKDMDITTAQRNVLRENPKLMELIG